MPSSGASGRLNTLSTFIESRLSREITGSAGVDSEGKALQPRERFRQADDACMLADLIAAILDEIFERVNSRAAQFIGAAAGGIEVEHVDDRLRDVADVHRLEF